MWMRETNRRLRNLEHDLELLSDKLAQLTIAHDELFDAVAEDLGYEAALDYKFGAWPRSPRHPTKTTAQPEVIRKKTARCK